MNWRSYQKTYMRSLKKQVGPGSLFYVFLVIIIILVTSLYITVKHYTRIKISSVSTQNTRTAISVMPPAKHKKTETGNGYRLKLSDNNVAKWVEHIMNIYNVRYGAVVAINIKTCMPVAIVSRGNGFSAFNAYPAASLAKLVTAAAAIEMHHISPYMLLYYNSGNASQSIKALTNNYNEGKRRITFSMALAKSSNPVFGKLALYKIGRKKLQFYFNKFYFNRSIGPSFIEQSNAIVDDNKVNVARSGAGLNPDVTLSPFHAALIAQAIGDNGMMCAPYTAFKKAQRHKTWIMSPQTAKELLNIMKLTISTGTSRKAFYNRKGKYILVNIRVAGKTGSIHGYNPKGDYEWFIGIAPANNPQLAVSVLVVNGQKWTVKGSYLGAQTFLAYFFPDAVKKLLHLK